MSENEIEEKVNRTIEKIDNYIQTLEAIIAFSHVLIWDDNRGDFRSNSYRFIARKMNTSENNRIKPNNEITPDLVVQLNETYGIVGEAKKSFPKNRILWRRNFTQLQKYDDDLKGWKTSNELITNSDIVLLTHNKIKVEVSDYIQDKVTNHEILFDRKFSAISFHRTLETKIFLTLEKFYGDLSDAVLNERFRRIVGVPLHKIIPLSNIKFYDDKPELPYIMEILWNKIFSQYPKMEDFMESGGIKIITINVNIDNLTQKLREQFTDYKEGDNRQPELPKARWVKKAMDMLVKLKYAEKVDAEGNNYTVKYKRIKNTLQRFTREIYKSRKKKIKTLNNFI